MSEAMPKSEDLREAIQAAHALVAAAIDRLDEAGAPADIAAHLDLALHRMASATEARGR